MASNPSTSSASHHECPQSAVRSCRLGAEVASVVPADVEADDLMAGCSQEWDEYRANVAAVASDENPHNCLLMVVAGGSSDQLVIQDQLRVASDSVRGAIYFPVLVVVAMKKYWSEASLTLSACQGHEWSLESSTHTIDPCVGNAT